MLTNTMDTLNQTDHIESFKIDYSTSADENATMVKAAVQEYRNRNYLAALELLTIVAYEGDKTARRLLVHLYRYSAACQQIFGRQACIKRALKWYQFD